MSGKTFFIDSVRREIAEARAEGLGLTEKRFLAALAAYRRSRGAPAGTPRDLELWNLVDALTSYVVQREACGMRDSHDLYALHGVPAEAVARIGARRPARAKRA